jgi:hypothetical protein
MALLLKLSQREPAAPPQTPGVSVVRAEVV